MIERVASRWRRQARGLFRAERQGSRKNPRPREQILPTRPEKKQSRRARHRDAARLGVSSEAFLSAPENFM
jgi:hypothetical protein